MDETRRSRIVRLFADLLDYPQVGGSEQAAQCRALIARGSPRAADLLDAFLADLERIPFGQLEELYTGAFDLDTLSDLDATCYPYVGHHLLGESYKRSTFMLELSRRYTALGFVVEHELPDHLVVMLRFLARCADADLAEELVGDAILPALSRMTQDGDTDAIEGVSGRRVYLRLLEALRLVLAEQLWPEAGSRPSAAEIMPVEAR